MPITVKFRGLDSEGSDAEFGTVTLDDDGKVTTDPPDSEELGTFAEDVSADPDPAGYMKRLPELYTSAYCRAEVTEGGETSEEGDGQLKELYRHPEPAKLPETGKK